MANAKWSCEVVLWVGFLMSDSALISLFLFDLFGSLDEVLGFLQE